MCKYWSQNGTEEYEMWKESHRNECSINRESEESMEKMEVQ